MQREIDQWAEVEEEEDDDEDVQWGGGGGVGRNAEQQQQRVGETSPLPAYPSPAHIKDIKKKTNRKTCLT